MVVPADAQVFPKAALRELIVVRDRVVFLEVVVECVLIRKVTDPDRNDVLRFVVAIRRACWSHRCALPPN
jgi:hypothetical protein